jgi:hypothetical protein
VPQSVELVGVGGLTVDPQGFQPGVAGQLGDQDEVFVASDELVDEGVPSDVGGDLVVQAGGGADGGEEVGPEYGRQGP